MSGFSGLGQSGGAAASIGQGLSGGTDSGAPSVPGTPLDADDKAIIDLAKKRFERTLQWESVARDRFLDDLKFAEADAYNGYQWPNSIRKSRDIDDRPCLTINKTRQHNLQIMNDAKQNKPGVAIRPTGNEATYEAAQVLEGIVRHIEYQSNATAAYDIAVGFQVRAGWGVLRVVTDYAGDDTFDQEIYIRPVNDPLSVMFDPDAKQPDKSDSRFAFIFDNIDREEFKQIYPQFAEHIPTEVFGGYPGDDWITESHVRVCEYFYTEAKEGRRLQFTDPTTGQTKVEFETEIPKSLLDLVLDAPSTRMRQVVWNEVRWVLLVGDRIAERKVWPGRYIPLIPVIGEETVIDGTLDRKGHTRALIDPQRMYNYWSSAAVEFGALQTKSPWVAPSAAIEGLEPYWNNANKQNFSVLPFNHIDDDGQPIPSPVRPQAPEQAPLYIQGMQLTQTEMMLVSGQYQAQMGQPSNERSGKAIQERQRQGDNATYHYIDNLGIAIRAVGRVLLDLIPKIYDTPRVMHILAEDGKSLQVEINPQAQQAYSQQLNHDGEVVRRIFNPMVGKYDVEADIGPGYATKREEAFNALTQIITQAPNLVSLVGDILLKNGDFPGAEEAAERLERMVPPQALGQGPSQAEQALQGQVQKLQMALSKTFDELASEKLKIKGKDQQKDIDVYNAETNRMKTLQDLILGDPEGAHAIVRQLVHEALTTSLGPVLTASLPGLAAASAAQTQTPQNGGTPQ